MYFQIYYQDTWFKTIPHHINNMFFNWFNTPPKKYVNLILQPDTSGMKYAGFRDGTALKLVGTDGETVGDFMRRFNTYRGPEEQIALLYTPSGEILSFTTVVRQDMKAVVKYVPN
jgi:hypothetical protein